VGRLPVAYYDANKTGALVLAHHERLSRGVRNLIGTGLVEFLGGLLTAVIALVMLLRISPVMTGLAFRAASREHGSVCVRRSGVLRPIFRERSKINAEVSGPAYRIAVRRSRGEGIPCGVARARCVLPRACNVCSTMCCAPLTTMSMMSFSTTQRWGGVGWRTGHACRAARQVLEGKNHCWPVHELYGVSGRS